MARLSSSVLLLLGTVCTPLALDASAAAPTPLPVATASVGTSALATASVGTAGGAGAPAPAASVGPNAAAIAASAPRLLIQGHQFTPAELHVPSGRKFHCLPLTIFLHPKSLLPHGVRCLPDNLLGILLFPRIQTASPETLR